MRKLKVFIAAFSRSPDTFAYSLKEFFSQSLRCDLFALLIKKIPSLVDFYLHYRQNNLCRNLTICSNTTTLHRFSKEIKVILHKSFSLTVIKGLDRIFHQIAQRTRRYSDVVRERMQLALNPTVNWSTNEGLAINPRKVSAAPYTKNKVRSTCSPNTSW